MTRKRSTIESKRQTEEQIRKDIGHRVQEIRNKLGLSAAHVAEKLDISREAITQIETGRNNISAVSLWKLAVLFKCAPIDFFPSIPDGYALTRVDLRSIAQEDEGAAEWAEKLFGKKKQK